MQERNLVLTASKLIHAFYIEPFVVSIKQVNSSDQIYAESELSLGNVYTQCSQLCPYCWCRSLDTLIWVESHKITLGVFFSPFIHFFCSHISSLSYINVLFGKGFSGHLCQGMTAEEVPCETLVLCCTEGLVVTSEKHCSCPLLWCQTGFHFTLMITSAKTLEQGTDVQRRQAFIAKMAVQEPQERSMVRMLALFSTQPLNGELYLPGCQFKCFTPTLNLKWTSPSSNVWQIHTAVQPGVTTNPSAVRAADQLFVQRRV